jgi:hypothetical protein
VRLERALADVVLGHDGGWSFWVAALVALEELAAESRVHGRDRFDDFPEGELRRLMLGIENALERASLAVELRAGYLGDMDARSVDEHRQAVADILLERARQHAAAHGAGPYLANAG